MTNSNIQNSEFKLGKSVLLLFLFQISVSIVVAFILYVLTDFVKVFPASMDSGNPAGIAGIVGGSIYFGQWMEKRYPGMLDEKRIKKLSLWLIIIEFMLVMLISSVLLYSDFIVGKPISLGFGSLSLAAIFMLFVMVIMYFMTKVFILRGIKSLQRKPVKL